jgi:ferredoxin
MSSLTKGLKEWGVPEETIHLEAFGADTVRKAAPTPTAQEGAAAFQVTFQRSNKLCAWSLEAGSLLDFAEANEVKIDSGCRAGNCGTCLTAIKSGEIRYLNEPGVRPEKGSCLACIAVPQGDLVLDA